MLLGSIRKLLYKIRRIKNRSYINSLLRKGLTLGDNSEILEPFFLDPQHCFLISIGSNCTLAPNVRLIAHDASTKKLLGFTRIGKITIHDKCFIGDSTVILPNVSIGPNSIIGASSLVNRDVPANVVAAGNPARVICSVEEYTTRMSARARDKGIFGADYLMSNLTMNRKNEILQALGKDEGFIV